MFDNKKTIKENYALLKQITDDWVIANGFEAVTVSPSPSGFESEGGVKVAGKSLRCHIIPTPTQNRSIEYDETSRSSYVTVDHTFLVLFKLAVSDGVVSVEDWLDFMDKVNDYAFTVVEKCQGGGWEVDEVESLDELERLGAGNLEFSIAFDVKARSSHAFTSY